ncbi:MAG: sulfate ABC transporter substrate-binding protein [Actinomycetota bacterium]|nr:sulfate ABC transporter substrate-binding protein [Actinomycetota bacterium]
MPTHRRAGRPARLAGALMVLGVVALLAACGGGPSDRVRSALVADGATQTGSGTTLTLYAYAVAKPAFDAVIPSFRRTPAGAGAEVRVSYGPSGEQSRKVAAGAHADVVSLAVEPDVTRLVDAGLVDPGWSAGPNHGAPFGSVVTLVVRRGNPKGVHDWADLLQPGLEVVTPNPFSSGSARWNLLAPYAAASAGGAAPQAGVDYVSRLVRDHVRVQPASGRAASEAFLQGTGDVLVSQENEALFLERQGDAVEHVTPAETIRVDSPVAAVNGGDPALARAFTAYLYSPVAQDALAAAGFRASDPEVASRYAAGFPLPQRLWTIGDLGGWPTVDAALFARDSGSIAGIYDSATR